MSQTDVDVVERFFKAFGAGDLETVIGLLSPDIVVNEGAGLPYGGDHVGVPGFQGLVGKIFQNFEMTLENAEVLDGGRFAVAKLDLAFKSLVSGRVVKMPAVELYTVTDGLVSHIDVYYKDSKAIHDLVAG